MNRGVREISEALGRDGYALLVVGESARRLYGGVSPPTLQVWTNADILYLAGRFELQPDEAPLPSTGASPAGALDAARAADGLSLAAGDTVLQVESDPLLTGNLSAISLKRLRQLSEQRPFTADALLFDPLRQRFLDPASCLQDIRRKNLRLLKLPAGNPLRNLPTLFRAVRMEADEGFTPNAEVLSALQSLSIAPDRQSYPVYRQGLLEVLTGDNPLAALLRLDDLGVLTRLLPELGPLKGCPQDKDYHPEGDVFTHTLECFRRVRRASPALALAILLHDIAKPETLCLDKRNLHFPGHSFRGAHLAGRILRRLGFDPNLVEEVRFCIRNHLLPVVLRQASEAEAARIVRHPWFPTLLRLYKEDVRGSMGDLVSYRDLVRRIAPWRPHSDPREDDE